LIGQKLTTVKTFGEVRAILLMIYEPVSAFIGIYTAIGVDWLVIG